MGAPATRITAADFLTPPELRSFRLAGTAAGRIGGVRLELLAGPRGTELAHCYQQVPLRVLPPFHFGPGRPALIYLLNPTAGLLDGDAQLVELLAGSGTQAVVVGQSASRIHPSLHGFSTQQWVIRVEAGATLVVLPGPAIPFRGSRYYQRVAVELTQGANLIWGDIWLAGRYARGTASEQFQFEALIQDLAVQRQGRLVFRDRFCWQGPWDAAEAAWHFGSWPACGNLFVTGPAEERLVASAASLEGGLFPTASGDTCFRWLGSSEAVAQAMIRTALRAASALAGSAAEEAWLLHNYDLAPNHWFTVERARYDRARFSS